MLYTCHKYFLIYKLYISAKRFGIKDTDKTSLHTMQQHLHHYLTRSMSSSNVFLTKVLHAAKSIQSKNLESVNYVKFGNFQVKHETEINQTMSVLANIMVIGSAMLGIVFATLTYRYFKK